jgi:hypothetical protein
MVPACTAGEWLSKKEIQAFNALSRGNGFILMPARGCDHYGICSLIFQESPEEEFQLMTQKHQLSRKRL